VDYSEQCVCVTEGRTQLRTNCMLQGNGGARVYEKGSLNRLGSLKGGKVLRGR
jgi:hypothetical protein